MSQHAMPQAPILGYITGATTPTRVRRVAAKAMIVVALVSLAIGISYAVVEGMEVCREIQSARTVIVVRGMFGPPPPVVSAPSLLAEIRDAVREIDFQVYWRVEVIPSHRPLSFIEYFLWAFFRTSMGMVGRLLILVYFLLPGMLLLVFVAPVRRGHRLFSGLAMWNIFPLIVAAFLLVLLEACQGLVNCLMSRQPNYAELWWLFCVPAGIPVILLMKDLCAYLRWISRNPIAEKPPVDFLPGKRKVAGSTP